MQKLLPVLQALSLICSANGLFFRGVQVLIIGGEPTEIQEIPYQAAFLFYNRYFCTGSIISKSHILTAAHCLQVLSPSHRGLSVRVGSTKINVGGEVINVQKIVIHPKFSPQNTDYDAAIAILEVPLTLKDTIRPLNIAYREPKSGDVVRVSGWGFIREIGPISRTLLSVRVRVVDRKVCQRNYRNVLNITKRMMCAAAENKDACYGDSGGPLVLNDKIVGIVSMGEGCARKEFPGIYTNVANSDIRKFIKNEMKKTRARAE